jgi:hypothetical protein
MWFSFSSMSCVSSCIHSLLWGICSSGCVYVCVSLMSSLVPGLRCTESEMWVINLCDFLCHRCIIIGYISLLRGNWDLWVSKFLCEFSFQLNQSPGWRRRKWELWVSVGCCRFMQSSLEVQENLKCGRVMWFRRGWSPASHFWLYVPILIFVLVFVLQLVETSIWLWLSMQRQRP